MRTLLLLALMVILPFQAIAETTFDDCPASVDWATFKSSGGALKMKYRPPMNFPPCVPMDTCGDGYVLVGFRVTAMGSVANVLVVENTYKESAREETSSAVQNLVTGIQFEPPTLNGSSVCVSGLKLREILKRD